MEKRYLAMWMWLCAGKLKVKIAHFRLPFASQKRARLSSLVSPRMNTITSRDQFKPSVFIHVYLNLWLVSVRSYLVVKHFVECILTSNTFALETSREMKTLYWTDWPRLWINQETASLWISYFLWKNKPRLLQWRNSSCSVVLWEAARIFRESKISDEKSKFFYFGKTSLSVN